MEHPLAIYVFSGDPDSTRTVIENTMSGGVTINDVFMHAAVPNAPFGGVGESGSGYYHGKYGLLAFSHLRTIVALPTWLDRFMAFRYPPYGVANFVKFGTLKAKFKRGEKFQDQQIKSSSQKPWKALISAISVAVLAVSYLVRR